MKTLDEVIEALNIWDAYDHEYPDVFYDTQTIRDALHYLKEYQKLEMAYIKAMADLKDNPSLTWDELKQMEGKPVWVEEKYSFSKEWHGQWEVIASVWDCEYDDDPYISMTNEEYRHKDDLGKQWQAYRKERNVPKIH